MEEQHIPVLTHLSIASKSTDMRKDANLDILGKNNESWKCGQINLKINKILKKKHTMGQEKSNSSLKSQEILSSTVFNVTQMP